MHVECLYKHAPGKLASELHEIELWQRDRKIAALKADGWGCYGECCWLGRNVTSGAVEVRAILTSQDREAFR